MPVSHAGDVRCPTGMHSPDGNVCVPGESMYDQEQAIRNRPFRPMTFREIQWSAIAMDEQKLHVTNTEMKFIGVSGGQKDMRAAQKLALDMCRSDGSRNCKLVETVVNSCLAISISAEDNKMEYVFSADRQFAVERSLLNCRKKYKQCKAAFADCN